MNRSDWRDDQADDQDAIDRSNSDTSRRSSSSYIVSLEGERYDLSNLRPTKYSSTGQLYPQVATSATTTTTTGARKQSTKERRRHSDPFGLHNESDSSDSCSRVAKALARSISDNLDIGFHLSDQSDSDKDSRTSHSAAGVGIGIAVGAESHPISHLNTAIGESSTANLYASAAALDTSMQLLVPDEEKLSAAAAASVRAQSSGLLPMFSARAREEDRFHSSCSSHTSHSDDTANLKPKAREEDPTSTMRKPAPSTTTSPTTPTTRDYLAVSLDKDGNAYLTIGSDIRVDYRGTTALTKAAIRNGDATTKLPCLTCEAIMTCLPGLQYVVCEACHTINPTVLVSAPVAAGLPGEEGKGAGVGLVAKKLTAAAGRGGGGDQGATATTSSNTGSSASPSQPSARSA